MNRWGRFGIATAILVAGTIAQAEETLDELLGVPPEAATPAASEASPEEPAADTRLGGEPSGPPSAALSSEKEEDSPGAAPRSEPRARQIEEIVVTAQKLEQNLQDVPLSITAVPGDFIREAGIDHLHHLVQFTPNVRFNASPCCQPVFIRGFGTASNITAFDPAVGLVLDELAINQAIYLSDPLYDVERFEVLRGPQGVLFGKNTTGGLFNVTTGEPTRELTGRLRGRYGGLGEHRVEGAIGGPLFGDAVRFRLSAMEMAWPDDVENTRRGFTGPDAKQYAGRAKLAIDPFPGLEVLLIGDAAATGARDLPQQAYRLGESNVDFLRDYDPRFEDDGFDHRSSQDFRTDLTRDTHRAQGNFRYSPGEFGPLRDTELVAILGYTALDLNIPRDFDLTPADLLRVTRFLTDYSQRSAEIRFFGISPAPFVGGEIELLTGLLVFDSDLLTDSMVFGGDDLGEWAAFMSGQNPDPATEELIRLFTNAVIDGDGLRIFSDQSTTSIAPFGQVSWRPTERWLLSAGARVTFEKKRALLANECFEGGIICAAGGSEEFRERLRRRDTNVSPRFAVQYFPLDELSLFATRSTGFKSGGYNNQATTFDSVEVETERAVSWETGAKGTLLDGALSYGGTFFYMDVDDLQLQNLVNSLVEVRNAASARSLGVELDLQWLSPWEPFTVVGAGAFTDARFVDYPNAPAPASSEADEQDLSGRRLPFVPKWQLNLTPAFRFPLASPGLPLVGGLLGDRYSLTTSFDVLYRSSAFLDADLDPVTRQGQHVLLHGRIGLSTEDEKWSLTLAGRNLTDADVAELIADIPFFFPGGFFTRQEFQPNWSLELRYEF